jgi:hypothetical protein
MGSLLNPSWLYLTHHDSSLTLIPIFPNLINNCLFDSYLHIHQANYTNDRIPDIDQPEYIMGLLHHGFDGFKSEPILQ